MTYNEQKSGYLKVLQLQLQEQQVAKKAAPRTQSALGFHMNPRALKAGIKQVKVGNKPVFNQPQAQIAWDQFVEAVQLAAKANILEAIKASNEEAPVRVDGEDLFIVAHKSHEKEARETRAVQALVVASHEASTKLLLTGVFKTLMQEDVAARMAAKKEAHMAFEKAKAAARKERADRKAARKEREKAAQVLRAGVKSAPGRGRRYRHV